VVKLTPRLAEGGLHNFSLYSRPVPWMVWNMS